MPRSLVPRRHRLPARRWIVTNGLSSGRSKPRGPPVQENAARDRRVVGLGWAVILALVAPAGKAGAEAITPLRGSNAYGAGAGLPCTRSVARSVRPNWMTSDSRRP